MKTLVIGGTVFLGRFVVEACLAAGHEVTVVNRGRENPDLFPSVDRIVADRDVSLDTLRGRKWDCVIDTCGYTSRQLALSLDAVRRNVPFYAFISTMSVYADMSRSGLNESDAVYTEDVDTDDVTIEVLGPLKAAAERTVLATYGTENSLIVRCGLLMGPYDVSSRSRRDHRGVSTNTLDYDSFSGRIPYWSWRAAQGDVFAAPGRQSQPLQVIDARDVAQWVVGMATRRQGGTFNAVGPVDEALTMGRFINAALAAAGSDAGRAVWVEETALEAARVAPLTGLPLWLPTTLVELGGLFQISNRRAAEAELTTRPIQETLSDILVWMREDPSLGVAATTPVISRTVEGQLIEAGANV